MSEETIRLTQEEQRRIDDFCANFVEGSSQLMGLSNAVTIAVKRYMARDIEQKLTAYLGTQR